MYYVLTETMSIRVQMDPEDEGKIFMGSCSVCHFVIETTNPEAKDASPPICRQCYKDRFLLTVQVKSIATLLDNLKQEELNKLRAYLDYLLRST